MTLVVTTFSQDGLELYGHRMIDSWFQHWPESYVLRVYTEGFQLGDRARLEQHDLQDTVPLLVKFLAASQAMLDDTRDRKQQRRIQKTIKWCHKVYAMAHALNDDRFQHVIWLDGDTYTTADILPDLAHRLVGDHLMAVHWESLKHGLHFETGLVVFNRSHPQMLTLQEHITGNYDDLSIYQQEKTWDGYHFSRLYRRLKLDVVDLARGHGVFSNPLVKRCLQHDAGKQKYLDAGYDHFTAKKKTQT